MKKETSEKAAKRFADNEYDIHLPTIHSEFMRGFEAGAEWAIKNSADNLPSEEDCYHQACKCKHYCRRAIYFS
jgi:hypothetical protein